MVLIAKCTSAAVALGSHAVDVALVQCIEDAAEPLRRACARAAVYIRRIGYHHAARACMLHDDRAVNS